MTKQELIEVQLSLCDLLTQIRDRIDAELAALGIDEPEEDSEDEEDETAE